jgi:hypothetical protein
MNPVLASLFATGLPDLEGKGQPLPPDGDGADSGGELFLTELGKAFERLSAEAAPSFLQPPQEAEPESMESDGGVMPLPTTSEPQMPVPTPTLQALRLSESLTILVPTQPVPEAQVADYARRIGLSEEALQAILPATAAPPTPILTLAAPAALGIDSPAPSAPTALSLASTALASTQASGEVVKLTITPPAPEPIRLVWPQEVAERWLEARGETLTSRVMSASEDSTSRQALVTLPAMELQALQPDAVTVTLGDPEGSSALIHLKTSESTSAAGQSLQGVGQTVVASSGSDGASLGGQSSGQEAGRQFSQQMAQRFSELISQRLVQQVQQGQWKVEMEVHPRDLGSIQIEMQWNNGQLEAVFETTHAATRELLLDNLPRLRESLQKFGTDVAYLGVGADSRQKNGGEGSSHSGRRGRSDRWDDQTEAASNVVGGLKASRSGHAGELDVLV